MDYGNSYTPDQINSAYQQLLNSGTPIQDIITGAKNNFGIGVDQIIAAQHVANPNQQAITDNTMRSLAGDANAFAQPGVTSVPGSPSGGGGGAAPSSVSLNAYTQNPYLPQMADDITRRVNLSRDQGLNAIRGNAVGVGGLGGSRQGVAEGLAVSGAADNLSGQLAGLFGGDYNNQMQRNLAQYQGDQSYNLGLGGLSNQRYGQDQNFYSQQRAQDQQGAVLGANLYNLGTQGQFTPLTQSSSVYSPYTGFGTTTGSTSAGGGVNGALGGAIAGSQLAGNLGFGGVPSTANSYGGANSYGFGTGSGFGNQDYGQYF